MRFLVTNTPAPNTKIVRLKSLDSWSLANFKCVLVISPATPAPPKYPQILRQIANDSKWRNRRSTWVCVRVSDCANFLEVHTQHACVMLCLTRCDNVTNETTRRNKISSQPQPALYRANSGVNGARRLVWQSDCTHSLSVIASHCAKLTDRLRLNALPAWEQTTPRRTGTRRKGLPLEFVIFHGYISMLGFVFVFVFFVLMKRLFL